MGKGATELGIWNVTTKGDREKHEKTRKTRNFRGSSFRVISRLS
jgi:hypothetical protein